MTYFLDSLLHFVHEEIPNKQFHQSYECVPLTPALQSFSTGQTFGILSGFKSVFLCIFDLCCSLMEDECSCCLSPQSSEQEAEMWSLSLWQRRSSATFLQQEINSFSIGNEQVSEVVCILCVSLFRVQQFVRKVLVVRTFHLFHSSEKKEDFRVSG